MSSVMDSFNCEYWCHHCNEFVVPAIVRGGEITCPCCDDGFVELIRATRSLSIQSRLLGFHDRGLTCIEAEPEQGERSTVISVRQSPVFVAANPFYPPEIVGGNIRRGDLGGHFIGPGIDLPIQGLYIQDRRSGYRMTPASKTAVEAMPAVTVSRDHLPLECAVCKEEFELGEVVRKMPCQHLYHSHCILPWLALNNTCPLCRFQMPTVGHREGQTPQRVESTSSGRNGNRRFSLRISRSLRRLFSCFSSSTNTRRPRSSAD